MTHKSTEIKVNIDNFNQDIEKSEQTSGKLKNEVGEMSATVEQLVDVGEYNDVTKNMITGLRSEIAARKNDIDNDLGSVNTKIESEKTDNGEMIEGLSNNIEAMGKNTNFEVATNASSIIENSSKNMKQALNERNEIAQKLDNSQKALQEVGRSTDEINL